MKVVCLELKRLVLVFQEASGWPSKVKTERQKRKFIKDYFDREGIILDPANMRLNAAARAVAKLLCNSFVSCFLPFFAKKIHALELNPGVSA